MWPPEVRIFSQGSGIPLRVTHHDRGGAPGTLPSACFGRHGPGPFWGGRRENYFRGLRESMVFLITLNVLLSGNRRDFLFREGSL